MTDSFPKERNNVCNFSISTPIYDRELPVKIKDVLQSMYLPIDQGKHYSLDVSFDKNVYENMDFFTFPVERKDWQIEQLKSQTPREQRKTIISEILSQQLENICKEIEVLHIPFRSTSIIGEDFGHAQRVDVAIYEDAGDSFVTSKKKSKKETTMVSRCIIPDQPWILKKYAELMVEMFLREMKENRLKEIQKVGHVPNLVRADVLFQALATEILREENETLSLDKLTLDMISHSQIKNDWPLEICGDRDMNFGENALTPDTNIDCPEYLVYTGKKSSWTIEKVADLNAAKTKILYEGFNQKSVKNMIVLHNLNPIPFSLFVENNGEILPISKSEAPSHKKILLSWNSQ